MLNMKKLNVIRRILIIPIRIAVLPFFPLWFAVGFLATDWEDEQDRKFFNKSMREFIKVI